MKAGSKHHWAQSRAMPIARALVAIVVALSFFAMVVTLGLASTGEPGLMACCIGKPGHESGSCNTGLPESAEQPHLSATISSSQQVAPRKSLKSNVAEVEDADRSGEHCSLHPQSASDDTESLNETSELETVSPLNEAGDPVTTSPETTEFQPEPDSASNERTGLGNIHALSSSCPMECGTCSVSYSRRPRPREQAIVSLLPKPRLPSDRRFSSDARRPVRSPHAKFLQLHPRAPPDPFV